MRYKKSKLTTKTIKKSISGFSLMEILIAIGILGIVMTGTLSLSEYMLKERKRVNFITTAQIIRAKLFGLVEDTDAWKKTVESTSNAIFECLRITTAPCNHNDSRLIAVHDQAGLLVYDSNTEGYDWSGNKCLLSAGQTSCPIHVKITSTLVCSSGTTCLSPSVKTIASFKANQNPTAITLAALGNVAFNESNYSFESYRKAGSATGGFISIVTPSDIIQEISSRGLYAALTFRSLNQALNCATHFLPTCLTGGTCSNTSPGWTSDCGGALTVYSWASMALTDPLLPKFETYNKVTIDSSGNLVAYGGTGTPRLLCNIDRSTGECAFIEKGYNPSHGPIVGAIIYVTISQSDISFSPGFYCRWVVSTHPDNFTESCGVTHQIIKRWLSP